MKAAPSELQQTVIDFVRQDLLQGRGDIELEPDDDLLTCGLVDSLGIMRLIQFLESAYGVSVPPADVTIENFMTARTICSYVMNHIHSNGQAHDS